MKSTNAFDDAEHAPSHQTNNDEAILSPLSLKGIEDRLRSEQQRLINEMEQRLLHELTKISTNNNPANSSVIQAIKINGSGDYLTRYIEGEEDGEQITYFSMPGDIFSMLCISDLMSRPFMYAMFILSTKLFFYTVILWEIFYKGVFFPKVSWWFIGCYDWWKFQYKIMHYILFALSGNTRHCKSHPICNASNYSYCH